MDFVYIGLLAFGCEYIDSALGMGYGTILSPILIIMGYSPMVVIPSILLSQALSGFTAAMFHQKHENVIFTAKSRDTKVVAIIAVTGIAACIVAALIAIAIPKWVLKLYIGILVLTMGAILLSRMTFTFSWKKMIGVGILSSFNKGMTGGGFGPVVTAGQIISGHEHRNAVGCTTMAEAPICLTAFATYCIFNGFPDWRLVLALIIGAICATPFGPLLTRRIPQRHIRPVLGALVMILGIWTIVKTLS